jgi:hypothetical protein
VSYAQDTDVPVEKSRAEIERILTRYGADRFMVGADKEKAVLRFGVGERCVQFELPLPDRRDFDHTPHRNRKRSEADAYRAWEQACRSRWRALRLCIQAKLEAVEVGITSFESEFLAHFVMPDGATLGSHVIPSLDVVMTGKKALPWFGDIKTTKS